MRTLREWREARGMSYRELAERAGVARWTVTRIESGRAQRVNRSTVQCLTTALGVEPRQVAEFAAFGDFQRNRTGTKRNDERNRSGRKSRMVQQPTSGQRTTAADGKVRVAIIGVGNCASSLVQGVQYYKNAPTTSSSPA